MLSPGLKLVCQLVLAYGARLQLLRVTSFLGRALGVNTIAGGWGGRVTGAAGWDNLQHELSLSAV